MALVWELYQLPAEKARVSGHLPVRYISNKLTSIPVFQPYLPNTGAITPTGLPIRFGHLEDLRRAFELDGSSIAAFIIEPIQGAAGYDTTP